MATGERIPIIVANTVVTEFVSLLRQVDCVERVQVAGSLRRGNNDPHDIEIVAIPKYKERYKQTLYGEISDSQENMLHGVLTSLLNSGFINQDRPRKDTKKNPFGPKYYRINYLAGPLFGWEEARWFPIDFFTATPENWGLILLLRTGSGDFNKEFVKKGYPYDTRIKDGRVLVNGIPQYTPDEKSVFRLMHVKYREPAYREAW